MRFSIILVFCSSLGLGLSCSQYPGGEQTVEERANDAEIIVYAKAIGMYQVPRPPLTEGWRIYTAEFQLLCALKSDGLVNQLEELALTRLPEEPEEDPLPFNVTEMGFAHGFCYANDVEPEQNYFMFLQEPLDLSPATPFHLQLQHVNGQKAVLDDTAKNRLSIAKYTRNCDILDHTDPVLIPEYETGPGATVEPSFINPLGQNPHSSGSGRIEPREGSPANENKSPLGGTTASPKAATEMSTTTPSSGNRLFPNYILLLFAFTRFLLNL